MSQPEEKPTFRVGGACELGISSEDVARFYGDNWARRIALAIPSFYRWQFCEPPENRGEDHNCVAATDDGGVLGVMGLNRRHFWLAGKLVEAAELTTWIVSEQARGLGVGRRMIRFLQERYGVLLGTGITGEALPVYLTSGFRFIRYIPRFVRIYDLSALRDYVEDNKLGERLSAQWSEANAVRYKVEEADPAALALAETDFARSFNFYRRDRAHLEWRFARHPVYQYAGFVVRGNGSGVSVVMRIEEIPGARIAHVVEIFGDDADVPAALSFIDQFSLDNGVAATDCFCVASKITRNFVTMGWFSTIDDYFFQFIHLFHPPELRVPPTTSLIYWARDDMRSLADTSRLYVTKADQDLDRPTCSYYESRGIPLE